MADIDPDAALEDRPRPLLIDEWQLVPDILASVKRVVDRDPEPGQFIVTGSARSDLLEGMWPATGRMLALRMWGITGRERFGDAASPTLFDRWESLQDRFPTPSSPPNLAGYLEIALTGGFPRAVSAVSEGPTKVVPLLSATHGHPRCPRPHSWQG